MAADKNSTMCILFMLSVIYVEWCIGRAECRYAVCRRAECRGAVKGLISNIP
jgi:hypothetical protein